MQLLDKLNPLLFNDWCLVVTVQTTVEVPQLLGVPVEVDVPVVQCNGVPQVHFLDGCDVPVFTRRI